MHVVVVFYCQIFLKPRLNAVEFRLPGWRNNSFNGSIDPLADNVQRKDLSVLVGVGSGPACMG